MQRTLQGAGEHPGQWPQVDKGQPGSGNPEYLGTGSQSSTPGLRLASRSNSWGVRALPSLTEHLLFDGSCWVPGTKEAPVPRGACSVPLTLNVRKRSSLNLTAGGPLYGPHPSLHPPPRTGRRPRGLCTSCSGCVHRCSSCTPMLSVNSFLSDFISNVTPPEEASQLLRLNQVVVFGAPGPPVFPRFLRQERSSESAGGHGLLPPFIWCPRPRSETPGSRSGDRPSCHGVPRARRRADGL